MTRTSVALAVAVVLFAGSATAQQPVATGGTSQTTIEDVLKAVREDLQGQRADVLAKNMTLSSDQAAKFWPMFASYQQEQNTIIDGQLRAVQTFIEHYEELDDAGAMTLINGHLDRDTQMVALRKKWLPRFQEILGTKNAVRAMQIDRRLSLVQQLAIVSKIPLAH